MQYTWDEAKRLSNLTDHGIDFLDAEQVFAGFTFTYEDDRFEYGEQRFSTLGLLKGIPVSIVHTETPETIRVISFRRATDHETQVLFAQIQDQLPSASFAERSKRQTKRGTPRNRSNHVVKGIVRHGLKVIPPKASISLRIDADVLDWFKSNGAGYQSRMNAVLRAFKEAAR